MNAEYSAHMFFDYQEEVKEIVKGVIALQKARQSFIVVGESTMGRTTLLYEIKRQLGILDLGPSSSNYRQVVVPVYLETLLISSTPQDFLGCMSDALYFPLSVSLKPIDIPFKIKSQLESIKKHSEPLVLFKETLKELADILSKQNPPILLRIVFLLDDLWRVKKEEIQRRKALIPLLRALHTEPSLEDIIAYIISGCYHELEEVGYMDSPLENILQYIELHVLSKPASLEFIDFSLGDRVSSIVKEDIYTETGGHPYLLEYLMLELKGTDVNYHFTANNVRDAIKKFDARKRIFERWWDKEKHLHGLDNQIYEIICQCDDTSIDKNISAYRIYQIISGSTTKDRISKAVAIQKSLRTLSTTGLIRKDDDGFYSIAGKWPARWFRNPNL